MAEWSSRAGACARRSLRRHADERLLSGYSLARDLLAQHRPDLLTVPTTSGPHATGDLHSILQASAVHASLVDLNQVQVHPTGFVDPSNPESSTKFLAAEALRGAGGILVDAKGRRFVNELDRRDLVSASIQDVLAAGHGPVRLLMTEVAVDSIKEHCECCPFRARWR